MPEYLAPGVYIEEIEIGPKSIEGVGTSTAAFLGECERGPTRPTLITGLEQYRRAFGSYAWTTRPKKDGSDARGDVPSTSLMRHAIEGFFQNGGKRCFVTRVAGDAGTASKSVTVARGTPEMSDKDQNKIKELNTAVSTEEGIVKTREGELEDANMAVADASEQEKKSAEAKQKKAVEELNKAQGKLKDAKSNLEDALGKHRGGPVLVVEALGPGSWANNVVVEIGKASIEALPGVDTAKMFRAVVQYWKERPTDKVLAERAKGEGKGGPAPWLEERYDDLSIDPKSSNYVVKRINGYSSLITVSEDPDATAQETVTPEDLEEPTDEQARKKWKGFPHIWLGGGTDAASIGVNDYKGLGSPGDRLGLAALETVDEVAIVCAPNAHEVEGLGLELVAHCETLKDRFAILQSEAGLKPVADLAPPTDSMFAAYYYPWIKVIDGGTGVMRSIPPVGHVAGIYARTDIERGVHKAPANEVVRGALGLQVEVTRGDQELLNPRGVNCIRAFPGRGIRVWGARTMSSDPLWKYVNVRRLFNYLEESIEESTQWVVFEPNNERLWSRVRQTIEGFLTTVWRDGALMGRTAEEAFFVKCDRTTMTDNDIETGRLIVLIGVAPTRPAEFVIFRVAQWRGGSSIEE